MDSARGQLERGRRLLGSGEVGLVQGKDVGGLVEPLDGQLDGVLTGWVDIVGGRQSARNHNSPVILVLRS